MTGTIVDHGSAQPPQPGQAFVYDGRLGEIYGIFIKNLLLGIVTLGFYRFWGKTNLRRYIWSHISLQGDRFEYTGTGGELFKGFLIVVGLFFVANIVRSVIALSGGPDSVEAILSNIVFALLIFYLIFVAQYAAQRYRLTRTSWRGVRGGMTGSAWAWGLKAMSMTVLAGLTVGLAAPWVQMRLIDDRLNNSYFGDAKASIQSSSRPLYLAFLVGALIWVIGTGALVGIAFVSVNALFPSDGDLSAQVDAFLVAQVAIIFAAYLGVLLLSLLAFAQYYVAMAREIAAKLTMAELRFGTTMTAGRFINRMFWNVLIIVLTVGLGLPIALHRTLKFLEANIQIHGQIDGSQITQSNLQRPKFGEGLLEAFDPGII